MPSYQFLRFGALSYNQQIKFKSINNWPPHYIKKRADYHVSKCPMHRHLKHPKRECYITVKEASSLKVIDLDCVREWPSVKLQCERKDYFTFDVLGRANDIDLSATEDYIKIPRNIFKVGKQYFTRKVLNEIYARIVSHPGWGASGYQGHMWEAHELRLRNELKEHACFDHLAQKCIFLKVSQNVLSLRNIRIIHTYMYPRIHHNTNQFLVEMKCNMGSVQISHDQTFCISSNTWVNPAAIPANEV